VSINRTPRKSRQPKNPQIFAVFSSLTYTVGRDKRLNATDRAVLKVLALNSWHTYEVRISVKRLGVFVDRSRRTIQQTLGKLNRLGYIETVIDPTLRIGRFYVLLWLRNKKRPEIVPDPGAKPKRRLRPVNCPEITVCNSASESSFDKPEGASNPESSAQPVKPRPRSQPRRSRKPKNQTARPKRAQKKKEKRRMGKFGREIFAPDKPANPAGLDEDALRSLLFTINDFRTTNQGRREAVSQAASMLADGLGDQHSLRGHAGNLWTMYRNGYSQNAVFTALGDVYEKMAGKFGEHPGKSYQRKLGNLWRIEDESRPCFDGDTYYTLAGGETLKAFDRRQAAWRASRANA